MLNTVVLELVFGLSVLPARSMICELLSVMMYAPAAHTPAAGVSVMMPVLAL
jgi:hypothetical protein